MKLSPDKMVVTLVKKAEIMKVIVLPTYDGVQLARLLNS